MRRRRHLLDAPAGISCNAPADLLLGAVGRGDAAARRALVLGLVAQHRIFHVGQDLAERLGLVVVAIDVDDAEILVAPLDCLLGRVPGAVPRGCGLLLAELEEP